MMGLQYIQVSLTFCAFWGNFINLYVLLMLLNVLDSQDFATCRSVYIRFQHTHQSHKLKS